MVSYYHQVYSHTVFSLTHSPIHVIPVNTSMVSYYHQVFSLTALRELVLPLTLPWCRTTTKCTLTLTSLTHTLPSMSSHSHSHGVVLPPSLLTHTHSLTLTSMSSHSHSHGVVLPPSVLSHTHSLLSHTLSHPCHPTHTPMVSYYHQVYPLTLTLSSLSHTLPWCRTTTKSSLTLTLTLSSLSLTLPWCRTTTKSSHTHTNPCAPTHSHLPCPHTLCSPHFISPHSHHQLIPTHLPHSPTHHASIASSSSHHLFLSPITTNRFLSLHTTLLTPPFHSQPSQSSPKSSPISIHTHSSPRRTP